MLDAEGISYEINPRLVRGLDYYNLTVFEWVTDALGAQGTVCGGGRYDGLVGQLGGNDTYAVGFGLGMERLILLLQTLDKIKPVSSVDVYILGSGKDIELHGFKTASFLRAHMPGVKIMTHCGGGSFKRQFKRADKTLARAAVILGDDEIARGSVTIKDLRTQNSEQLEVALKDAPAALNAILNK